jgi:hypothetical protein
MNSSPAINRQLACCLILSAVLVLGIVQWSFLPVLIQNASQSNRAVVEVSLSHSSKFAAPFKYLLGNFHQLCLKQSGLVAPPPAVSLFHLPTELPSRRDDEVLSFRQLRSPPSS